MEIRYSVTIQAPAELAFDHIDDDRKNLLWMDGLVETVCSRPFDRQNPVGKEFVQRLKFGALGVEYHGEVTNFVRPEWIGLCIRDQAGNYQMQVDYLLAPAPEGGVRLDYVSRTTPLTPTGAALVAGMRMVAKRMVIAQMTRLRTVVEAAASATSAAEVPMTQQ